VHVSVKALRFLYWSALCVFFVASAILLGARYFVLPNINSLRPTIQHLVGTAMGKQVSIGGVEADWQGLNPRLTLSNVAVRDDGAATVLVLPKVSAVLGWRSMLALSPRLLNLRVEGLDIDVRRDASDRLWVAGQSFSLADSGTDPASHPALAWLGKQRDLALVNATIRWSDEKSQAPTLVLTQVDFRVDNRFLSHRFRLTAQAEAAAGSSLDIRGEITRAGLLALHPAAIPWRGHFYVSVGDADLAALNPWMGTGLSGRVAGRAWFDFDEGRFSNPQTDLAARDLAWSEGANTARLGRLRVTLSGLPGALGTPGILAALHQADGPVHVKLGAGEGRVHLPAVFDQGDIALTQLDTAFTLQRNEGHPPTADIERFAFANDDVSFDFTGRWIGAGKTVAGWGDWRGNISRGSVAAFYRYLPVTVPAQVRQWLGSALRQGEAHDMAFHMKGDLDDFPFDRYPGDFTLAGRVDDATLDYGARAAAASRYPWPPITNLSGTLALDNMVLKVAATGPAIMQGKTGAPLTVTTLRAEVPDVFHRTAIMSLEAASSGAAQSYLDLVNESPLAEKLDGALARARAGGQWEMPLKLRMPLDEIERTTVNGSVQSADSSLTLAPDLPTLSAIKGALQFSEKGLRTRELGGVLLGGPVKLNGRLEGRDQDLKFSGQLSGDGLREIDKGPLLARFSGQAAYSGRIAYNRGGLADFTLQSDLRGLAVDLPAPAGKAAAETRPLAVAWGPQQDKAAGGKHLLSLDLGDEIHGRFEYDPAVRAAIFTRGILAVNRPVVLPARGLNVDAKLPALDVDAWQKVRDDADALSAGRGGARTAPLFAAPSRIDLATDQLRASGISLDALTLNMARGQQDQWQAVLQSRQATGTVTWQESSPSVEGRLTARFERLAVGGELSDESDSAPLTVDRELTDIPAIDLQAKQFLVYGKPLGALNVLGANLSRGEKWRLDTLEIVNQDTRVDASGTWTLKGKDRGLSVKAALKTPNLGAFFDRIGFPGKLSGAAGVVEGELTWRNLPWTHNLTDVNGDASITLDKGRFVHLTSYTARLLELLSLQSVARLASLDFFGANPLREGFPFDTIRGKLHVADGVITTDDYKVNGPVATIVLAGSSRIIDQTWNMKAVVVPHFDASGAAIATGLAINPLIGVGAFVTQWLLQRPLARAATAQYAVTGSWDDPKIQETRLSDNQPVVPYKPRQPAEGMLSN
jgi:uncharacterized protein (TIGR02099 family)